MHVQQQWGGALRHTGALLQRSCAPCAPCAAPGGRPSGRRGQRSGAAVQQQQQQLHDELQLGAPHAPGWPAAAAPHSPPCDGATSGSSTSPARGAQQPTAKQRQHTQRRGDALAQLRERRSAVAAARHEPRLLTAAIMQCGSLAALLGLFSQLSPAFNHVHAAALVARLPKVLRGAAPLSPQQRADLALLLQDLEVLCEEVLPDCSPRELANMAWGFAAATNGGGACSRRLMQLLLARARLAALAPQELASLAWAVARAGHEPPEGWVDELLLLSGAALHAGALRPREAAILAWALASLQRQCLLAAAPPLRRACARVDAGWKEVFCGAAAAQARAGALGPADVTQGLWALAVLGCGGVRQLQLQGWLDAMLLRGAALLQEGGPGGAAGEAMRMRARNVAPMLWAVSRLQQQQQQQWVPVGAAAAAAAAAAGGGGPSHHQPGDSSSSPSLFVAAVAGRLPELLAGERQPLRFAAVLLNTCARLQVQLPPPAMNALLAGVCRELASRQRLEGGHSGAGAPGSSGAGSAGAGSSCGMQPARTRHQRHRPSEQQLHRQQQAALQEAEADLLDISVLLHGLVRTAYLPARNVTLLLAAAAASACWQVVHTHDRLAAAAAAAAAAATAAAAAAAAGGDDGPAASGAEQQQQEHRRHVLSAAATAAALRQRLPRTRGQELSLLLWALAKLRAVDGMQRDAAASMPGALLGPLRMAALRQLHLFNAADVGVLWWALARARATVGPTWAALTLQHFLSVLDDCPRGAPHVAHVVHALPLLAAGAPQRRELRAELAAQRLLQRLAAAAAARFGECGPRELVQLAQGFGRLGYSPGRDWVRQHQDAVAALVVAGHRLSERERAILSVAYHRVRTHGAHAGAAATPAPAGGAGPALGQWQQQQQQQQQQQSLAAHAAPGVANGALEAAALRGVVGDALAACC